jgi:hypothetical protein
MRRATWLAVSIALIAPVGAFAQKKGNAQPAPAVQSAAAPWANKFFLADIAANREQTPPPVIVHNFGEVPHGTVCSHTFTVMNIYDVPMQITEVRKSCTCLEAYPFTKALQPN